jgi:ethanolamine ammonia-lyase small subunit
MLIGERPGLSSPASLGAYVTWAPRPGRNDAERNCVSNIHSEGLDYAAAAAGIAWLLGESRRLGLSGVALRESEMPRLRDSTS